MNLLTLDTETGGLDPASDALLTVGLIASSDEPEPDTIKETLHIEIQPEVYLVWDSALAINKINMDDHKQTALSRKKAAIAIIEFIERNFDKPPTVCGHNTGFDTGFLNELFNATDNKIPYGYRSLDTSSNALFMKHLGIETGGNLPSLLRFYGITHDENTMHNALVDAQLTREVYIAQRRHMARLMGV